MTEKPPFRRVRHSFRRRILLSFTALLITLITGDILIEFYGIPGTPIKGEFAIKKEEVMGSLSLMADLNKKHFLQWLSGRRGDTEVLSNSEMLKFNVSSLADTIRQLEKEGLKGNRLWDEVRRDPMYRSIVMHLSQVVSSYKVYESIRIVDPATDRIIGSTSEKDLGFSYRGHEDFTEVLNRNPQSTGIGYHFHGDTFHLDFSRPIQHPDPPGGGFSIGDYVVHSHVSTDDLTRLILESAEELGETGEATLVNEKGILMTPLKHTLPDGSTPRIFASKVEALPAVLAASRNEGTLEVKDYRGEPVLAAYRYIPLTENLGWGMVVKQDIEEIFAPLRKKILFHFIYGGSSLLLMLGLASLVTRKLARPVDALTAAAAKVEGGDLDARATVTTSDEIGFLSESFNSMVAKIQNWHGELEEKIRTRTSELEKSEKNFRDLVDNALVGVFKTTLQGKILYVNEALFRSMEYESPEELIRQGSVARYRNPEDRELFIEILMKKGKISNFEVALVTRSGKEVNALVSATLERDTISGMILDISDSKRITEALMESERRFRDLVESSLTGILIVRGDTIIYKNTEFTRAFGEFTTPLKIGKLGGIHPEDSDRFLALFERITSGAVKAEDQEFRYLHRDEGGTKTDLRWIYCRASRISYQGEDAALVNVMDITRSKELEMVIKDRVTSLGRVAAGIAHEIRNPLSGINIYLRTLRNLLSRETGAGKEVEIVSQIQSASNKIESVVRRALDFSRPGETRFSPTYINGPVEEAVELSRISLRKSGIEIEKALSPGLPSCYADSRQIEQVVLNLISNSAEALSNAEGKRKIRVATSLENNSILLKISDSGPGVPFELRKKIFDPFFTTKSENTGLGLSISNRIITDHGGHIDITESEWGGAEFVLSIPKERRRKKR